MIKHIVAFRLKKELDTAEKAAAMDQIKVRLEALPPVIDELLTAEVGLNFNPAEAAFDVVLTTTHDSVEALGIYAGHPDHQAVVAYILTVISDRVVVDYEV